MGSRQDGIAGAWLGTESPGAELELENSLEAPSEVLVAEPVDDGVDAAVEEGQPVSKGINVDVDELQLEVRKAGVVREQHQGPQGKPGQGEKQSHNDEHFDDFLFPLPHAVPLLLAALPCPRHGWVGEGDADPGVHDDDERQGSQVNVGKENRRVDFPHSRVRPLLPAPEHRAGGIARAQEHPEMLPLLHLQQDCRGTHDGHGQDPDDHDDGHGSGNGQLLLEGMHNAPEPAAEKLPFKECFITQTSMHTHFKLLISKRRDGIISSSSLLVGACAAPFNLCYSPSWLRNKPIPGRLR